jgi:hypothetical protein
MLLIQPQHALMHGMQQQAHASGSSSPVYVPGTAAQLLTSRRRTKQEICEAYLLQLSQRGDLDCSDPAFIQAVRAHFDRLPTRYALVGAILSEIAESFSFFSCALTDCAWACQDVNLQSLDVLSHKRLLDEARADPRWTLLFVQRQLFSVSPASCFPQRCLLRCSSC